LALLSVGWFLPISPLGWLLDGPAQAIVNLLLG
jgi:hypothetical protein